MAKRFSTIGFNPMVESINRKFARRIDTVTPKKYRKGGGFTGMGSDLEVVPGHTYMGASSRIVNVIGVGSVQKNIMFFRKPWERTTPLSNDETEARTNFGVAAHWVKMAAKNLSVIAQNRQKFNQAKEDFSLKISGVNAFGYTTMRGWMFAIAVATLQEGGSLSQDGALPAFDA